jgi:formylglycine-generating enzyme required for sulfatase activity
VSGFRLDKYDVTVGRFRQFVNAVLPADGGVGWLPPAGSGKHIHLNGGQGLANNAGGGYEPGWVPSDNSNIAPTNTNLSHPIYVYGMDSGVDSGVDSGLDSVTWTPSPSINENLPITCVNWYEAYAFCIWDGGFLPSVAEREYAAAGGDQERRFPWGSADPGTANRYATYGDNYGNCTYPSGTLAPCTGVANIAPVGTATLGVGLWGQLDLSGNVWQWDLDSQTGWFPDPCKDCAYLTASSSRIAAGGSFDAILANLYPPAIGGGGVPTSRYLDTGFRCAFGP